MVLPAFELNIPFAFRQQLSKLQQGFLRKDHASFRFHARRMVHVDERQAMAIRGYQSQTLRLDHELGAVQEIPCVFAGNRELCLGDHFANRCARKRCTGLSTEIRQRRKVFARECLHARIKMVRRNFDAVLVLFDPDVRFRQSLHNFVEFFCWQRQRTTLRHSCVTLAAQRYFEIGREHPNLIAFGFKQHIRKDRNRVLALDDALEKLQFSQKLSLADN